jgi:hypothetical protein
MEISQFWKYVDFLTENHENNDITVNVFEIFSENTDLFVKLTYSLRESWIQLIIISYYSFTILSLLFSYVIIIITSQNRLNQFDLEK